MLVQPLMFAGPLLALDLTLPTVIAAAASLAAGTLVLFILIRNFLYLCRPNEILILTGRKRVADGRDLGPMIVMGRGDSAQEPEFAGAGRGRAWRIPVIERVDRMDVTTLSTDIVVQNAYSAGNIPLRIHGVANVKIHSNPKLVRNAIERFLGRAEDEIRTVAQQTLEGALREVLANMTPEAVNQDRLEFAEQLMKAAREDLDKLGLQLDTLKIQSVSDETGYLDSLGRPRIASALRDAENSENQAQQEITEAQAEAHRRAEVAKAEAEMQILAKRNELSQINAELEGEARAVEEEAVAAARTARAEAERELQSVRRELEDLRLQADVVIPAEIAREAEALKAIGDAAPTREQGAALVSVLEETAAAWRALGPQAKEIYVIQHLDEIVGTVVRSLSNVNVAEVNVLDSGDGRGLAGYAASYPHMVASVLEALAASTGIDVPAIVAGRDRAGSAPPTPPPGARPLGASPLSTPGFGGAQS